MMSGGDLDGDVYMCIWDKALVEAVKEVHNPASTEKAETEPMAQKDHIVDYVAYYMQNDTLGELSNLHVAMCD